MGEGIHREVLKDKTIACRVYAPVGEHRDLLAYLVRRLLENGANSSSVHQLADETVGVEALLASPLAPPTPMALPLPVALYGQRRNSMGVDLASVAMRAPLVAAVATTQVGPAAMNPVADVDAALQRLHAGWPAWQARPLAERAALLHLSLIHI